MDSQYIDHHEQKQQNVVFVSQKMSFTLEKFFESCY